MEFNALNQFIQPLKKDYFLHVADFIKIVFHTHLESKPLGNITVY